MRINKEKAKKEWKERLITALIVAPSLAVMLLSAIYNLATGLMGINIESAIPQMMSWLTILVLLASTVLTTAYKRRFPAMLLATLFSLCFICYLCFYLSGTTDLYADGFFETLMLMLSLPIWSYMPVAMSLSSVPAIPALILTGFFAAINLAVWIWMKIADRKEESSCRTS